MARSPRNRGGPLFRPQARPAASNTTVTAGGGAAAAAAGAPARAKVTPAQFIREVRAEARKITWPSRRETWITSVFVFIMVVVAAAFFALADGALAFLLQSLLRWVS
jgi:preprotein translocase subunit SecE